MCAWEVICARADVTLILNFSGCEDPHKLFNRWPPNALAEWRGREMMAGLAYTAVEADVCLKLELFCVDIVP